MNLASEVSAVLSDLDSFKTENIILREREVALTVEVDQLRAVLSKTQSERDIYLRQAEAMKSILTQAGSGLVNAMNAFRAGEREVHEQALDVASEPMAKFISEGTKSLHAVG